MWSRSVVFKAYFLLPLLAPIVWWWPRWGQGLFHKLERMLDRLALKPGRAVFAVGLVSFLFSAALGISIGINPPQTHDEFGYLLIADTLAHGRLTNPPHSFWEHFESIYVLLQPTYTSKYPPAQGLALAIGEITTGLPIVGIWFTTALASATVCWMLLAWMRPRWALVGGLLTAFHPQMIVWSQNYWGGAVAMAGGAIVLGAFRRLLRDPRPREAFWLGIGMAILANSRPYEGFVFCLLICLTLGVWIISARGPSWKVCLYRIAAPLLAVLAVLALQLAFYNYRVTGSAWQMPYSVYQKAYGMAPLFVFQQPKPEPVFRHAELRALQLDSLAYYQRQRTSSDSLLAATWEKIHTLLESCLWSRLLVVPLLALPWAMRGDRWLRLIIPGGALFSATMLLGTWVHPHYAAPAVGFFVVLVVESMRQLKVMHSASRRWGVALVRGVLVLCALSSVLTVGRLARVDRNRWDFQRERIMAELATQPGRHLVFVHYQPNHNPHREWVYNSADIDSAKTVVARIMSPPENQQLRQYFAGRDLWIIEADATPAALLRLPDAAELPAPAPVHPEATTPNRDGSSGLDSN